MEELKKLPVVTPPSPSNRGSQIRGRRKQQEQQQQQQQQQPSVPVSSEIIMKFYL